MTKIKRESCEKSFYIWI